MKTLIGIIIFSIFIIALGFILYFYNFNDNFSNDGGDWGDFATFNGYFISIVNLIVLGYISYVTFQTTHTFNKLQIRPILFLSIDKPDQIKNVFKDSWYVTNGAKNPALSLIIRYTTNRNSNNYTKWVSCTSIVENQRIELFWIHWADKIDICFTDITNERFYLLEYMDFYGKTTEISNSQYNIFLNEALENRNNGTIHLRDKMELYINTEKQKGINPMTNYIENFIKKHI